MKNKLCAKILSYFYTIWILTDKTSSKTTFVPKFVLIFYTYSSNHSLLRFLALDIQIKVCFGFNILSCNPFLYFISTPYNRLPTFIWFNLRYK